jgi:hypothetical protein
VAKDKAYIGYKCHALVGNTSHAIYGIRITPANTGDAKHFIPLMEQAASREILDKIFQVHGDCAYHVALNLDWLEFKQIECKFHDKDESGLHRKNKRSARKKSKIRSVIEALFGIAKNNLTFEKPLVRGMEAIRIDTSLVFTAWNLFMAFARLENRWIYRVSVKKLFNTR